MNITFYNYVLSGNCYKFRLLANMLNVEYESIAVDFHPGLEHKSESFLALNPAGTRPILQVGHVGFTETQAMLRWLAQHHDPSHSWWPSADADKTVATMQWLSFSSRLSATVGKLRLHSMLDREIDVAATTSGALSTLRELESHLAEQRIRGSSWLVADSPTIADIACFPYTMLSPDAGIEHDAYPAIKNWLYELRSLDGFITMPGIPELHEQSQRGS
jgi:glutathione S-transferase